MNVRAARWALAAVTQTKLAPAAAHVLLVLACHTERGGAGWAWPSVGTLADETKLDRRTVMRSVAALETAGLVTVERPGRGHLNRYKLSTSSDMVTLVADRKLVTFDAQTSDTSAQTSDTSATQRNRKVTTRARAGVATGVNNCGATFLKGTGWVRER